MQLIQMKFSACAQRSKPLELVHSERQSESGDSGPTAGQEEETVSSFSKSLEGPISQRSLVYCCTTLLPALFPWIAPLIKRWQSFRNCLKVLKHVLDFVVLFCT